jgi:uncharacterized protein (DUF1697 family)
MPKYVAFLRAINVGGHTVKMDHLRGLFEALSFSNVETFIASGNVIFDTKSKNQQTLERKIEKHLQETLGYAVTTFLRSTDELTKIAAFKPFSDSELTAEGNQLYVAFTAEKPGEAATQKLMSLRSPIDDFHINEREVYWLYRRWAGESKFYGGPMEKCLAMQTTLRNFNTVRKLAAKYS